MEWKKALLGCLFGKGVIGAECQVGRRVSISYGGGSETVERDRPGADLQMTVRPQELNEPERVDSMKN